MQARLPALATRGAEEGQQMDPRMATSQLETQAKAVELEYCWYLQLVKSEVSSQMFTWTELTVVEFTYPQLATQEEFYLTTNFEVGQEEHRNAAGEPRLVAWIPRGRAHDEMH